MLFKKKKKDTFEEMLVLCWWLLYILKGQSTSARTFKELELICHPPPRKALVGVAFARAAEVNCVQHGTS